MGNQSLDRSIERAINNSKVKSLIQTQLFEEKLSAHVQ